MSTSPPHTAIDRRLIDLYEDREVRDASKNCTEQDLRDAVAAVGYSPEIVSEFLKSRLWRAVR